MIFPCTHIEMGMDESEVNPNANFGETFLFAAFERGIVFQ